MVSLALFILRAAVGSLLAGHGSQKLFGSFGGQGVEGTGGWLESMGFQPGRRWAVMAGAAEFSGGVLTALGFLNPLGPTAAASAMIVATAKAHKGKPIWVTSGGAELPVTNMAALAAITIAGPGAISLDRLLGIRIPRWFSLLAMVGTAWLTYSGVQQSEEIQRRTEQERRQSESQAQVREAVMSGGNPAPESTAPEC